MGIITTKNKRAEKLTDLAGKKSSDPQTVRTIISRLCWYLFSSIVFSIIHKASRWLSRLCASFICSWRKPQEPRCCSEEGHGHCVCWRAVPVQLPQPGLTDAQVGSLQFTGLKAVLIGCLCVWRHMPGHTSREILIILSSLTTCDPGNIYELVKVENPPSVCFSSEPQATFQPALSLPG